MTNNARVLAEFGEALIQLGRRIRKLARRASRDDLAEIQRALDDLRAAVAEIAVTDN